MVVSRPSIKDPHRVFILDNLTVCPMFFPKSIEDSILVILILPRLTAVMEHPMSLLSAQTVDLVQHFGSLRSINGFLATLNHRWIVPYHSCRVRIGVGVVGRITSTCKDRQ